MTQVKLLAGHRYPDFLPDGRHFLFYERGGPEGDGIYLASLDGGAPTRLTAADSGGAFLPPDLVAFVRQGTLVARRLDLAGRTLTGEPITLADSVGVDQLARGGFAVSSAGVVAYRAGGRELRQLTWVDRTGTVVGVAGEPDGTDLRYPEWSPDGRRVAMRRTVQGNTYIWHRSLHPLTGPGLSSPSMVMAPSLLNTAPFFMTNCTLRTASMSSSGFPGPAMRSA